MQTEVKNCLQFISFTLFSRPGLRGPCSVQSVSVNQLWSFTNKQQELRIKKGPCNIKLVCHVWSKLCGASFFPTAGIRHSKGFTWDGRAGAEVKVVAKSFCDTQTAEAGSYFMDWLISQPGCRAKLHSQTNSTHSWLQRPHAALISQGRSWTRWGKRRGFRHFST